MHLDAFYRLVRDVAPAQAATLLALMLLSSASEGIGVLLLVPLLEVLQHIGAAADGGARGGLAGTVLDALAALGVPPTPAGLLAVFIVLVAARSGLQRARERRGTRLQFELVDRLRTRVFAAVLGARWRWLAAQRGADTANALLTEVNRVGMGFNQGIGLLANLVLLLAYLCAAAALSWPMTLLAAGTGLVGVLLTGQRRRSLRTGERLGDASRRLQRTLQNALSGIRLTKILGNEARVLDEFAAATAALRAQQLRFADATSGIRALLQTVAALVLALYVYVGLTLLHAPMAELLALVLVFGRLVPLLSSAQQQHQQWLNAVPAQRDLERLLGDAHAAAEVRGPSATLGPALTLERELTLEHACVQYPGRTRPALHDVGLTLRARTTTALVGPSGAGKSTLADVLMGLLDMDSGTLTVDGHPIDEGTRAAWRRAVAYVPQETFLFDASIRDNLRWGEPDASDDAILAALQRAACDFVLALPARLDTPVGDGGVRFSGGERQRLGLARALLSRPALLILDEATSALDPASEAAVRAAIEALHGELTVLIVGHRTAMLEHADDVIALADGRVVDRGSWADLRRRSGVPA